MNTDCKRVLKFLKMLRAFLQLALASTEVENFAKSVNGISADQVERFWSYVDEGGVNFAQEIVDYV